MNKSVGYVYILTNPSFREDWIKVGKSSRPVDVRSKELDNTSVPLPFEIYGTVKTSKYNELEREFHAILTNLAKSRIRENREFFNITPQEAFEHLVGIAKLIDDAEINFPEDLKENVKQKNSSKKPFYKGKYVVETNEIFYFYRDGVDAKMKVVNGNKFVVLKGSKIDPNVYSNASIVEKARKENSKNIVNWVTTVDIVFNSPSTAGCFVGGGAVNGKYYWRTINGDKKLDEFIKYI